MNNHKYWLLGVLIVPLVIYAMSELLTPTSGWITFEKHCESLKDENALPKDTNCAVAAPYITRRSELQLFGNFTWAGLVSHVYYDLDMGVITGYKARVAIVNSDSPYGCGKTVVIDIQDAKEVKNRSVRHKLCE